MLASRWSLCRCRLSLPVGIRRYSGFNGLAPFDVDEQDDKYKELNSMYVDMFTTEPSRISPLKSEPRSELDQLNEELDQLYNSGPLMGQLLNSKGLQDVVESEGQFVLQSLSSDPYFNLALEDYVFRYSPVAKHGNHRLLFYVNDRCAVIGKNQTIWKELHTRTLRQHGYQILRRLSGGGAVIHDLGNVNYSYITSRDDFDRNFFNKCIIDWLKRLNNSLPLGLSKRGDITFNGLKISGSAFKIAKGKAYHHGTMLLQSSLQEFSKLLKPNKQDNIEWECNSVNSVRSPITNLPSMSPREFINILTQGFRQRFVSQPPLYYYDDSSDTNKYIRDTMNMLQSEDWKYCSGPPFVVRFQDTNDYISVKKGTIIESTLSELVGMKFTDFIDLPNGKWQTKISQLA